LAVSLNRAPGIHALAADTDGVDGAAEMEGVVVKPNTLDTAHQAGAEARAMLNQNDAHSFFARIGQQVITGPTFTLVNGFRAILIGSPA
jgi:hydroxypyruvate reductase